MMSGPGPGNAQQSKFSPDDWSKIFAGAGGIGGGLMNLFGGGGKNPADAASKYYDQIPDTLKQYLSQYINSGKTAMGDLEKEYGNLLNDPGSILARLGKGYTESPGFKFERDQGLNSINNAAAAGGMMGTNMHQQQAGELATNLANKDYGDYLTRAMGMYGQGLHGKQGINEMGYGASNNLAQMLAQTLMNKGNMAYEGQAAKNKSDASGWADIFSGAAKFAPLFFL